MAERREAATQRRACRGQDRTATVFFPRLRHLRGHGIHSPFVYDLVRNVFSRRKIAGAHELYDDLRGRGLRHKTARRIQNLHVFCGAESYEISNGHTPECAEKFTVVLPAADFAVPEDIFARPDVTFAVPRPYKNKRLAELCRREAEKQQRLTVDSRGLFIIFGRERLPRQNFKI